jgi:thioredoxin
MTTKKQFNSFEEMLSRADFTILVYFYAELCCPCHMLLSILEQVNNQLKDRLRIVKIDTEKYTNLATQYQISALPTLVLFKQGQPVDRIEGVMQAQQLVEHLKSRL